MPPYVPAWLVAPVLRIAIPDTPFGRGNAGRPIGEEEQTVAEEPDTVGFAEADPLPSADARPAAVTQTESVEPAAAPPDTEPAAAPEPIAALPAEAADIPEAQTPPVSEPAPQLATETRDAVAPEAGEPEPPVEASYSTSTPREAEDAKPEEQPQATASPPRAARPLGAPQAGSRPIVAATPLPTSDGQPAGLPATELPPVVEPEAEPSDATDTAVGLARDDRPTMRNRRLYRRVGIEAEFEIDGVPAKLLDLSMGGFGAANAPPLAANAVVPVTVRLAIDGVEISTRMRARMIYVETPRNGGRFIDLTASQTAFLRYVVTWRGQSLGALGAATLLEAITRPPERFRRAERPSLEPPGRAERRTPWWSRMFGWFRARGAPE